MFLVRKCVTGNGGLGAGIYLDLYSLPNIVRVVKSRRMRWAGHVARMGEDRGVHRVLVGKPRERGRWGDQDVDVRIILRWILRKLEGAWGLDGVGSG